MNLDNAFVYDVETLPNCFTLSVEMLNSDERSTWEISQYRDERQQMFAFLNWVIACQAAGIGFNNVYFDYSVIHFNLSFPDCTVQQIYDKAMSIIQGDRFGNTIWASERHFPQIDLFKIHHFDNKAKTTSLKALQINMRSPTVVDSPIEFGVNISREDIDTKLIPYNIHDVQETKRFAFHSMDAIQFRLGLVDQFGIDVLNYNDVKIGSKMLEKRLGEDVCYDRSSGRKKPRQTIRNRIPLADIIFPYIKFDNPEFQRVLDFMRAQVLTPDDLDDPDALVKTKGVFKGLTANVGGIEFAFGTGGVHASVSSQRFAATDEWLIRDIDVKALYPSIAIVNRLAPAHLGEAYVGEYAKIPIERATHPKGSYENGALKLASNGPWGQSNNKYSIFFDSQYAMTIPINGQLMICMLAQELVKIPTLSLIQANTDGITYRIHRDYEPLAVKACKAWEAYTLLELEDANYSRMWIRDVNNYVAEDKKGKLKQKGAYWFPDPLNYADSISKASPPCWYKDFNPVVVPRAAVAAMVHNIGPETFLRSHSDPYDFMLRVRVDKASKLLLGGQPIQNTIRYYVAKNGAQMTKHSPARGPVGGFKRRNGMTDAEFNQIAATVPAGQWDERIHTKNRSTYDDVMTNIEAGWNVCECNDIRSFRFDNLNYDYYIAEARKLIIA